jgi:hypothetical protein
MQLVTQSEQKLLCFAQAAIILRTKVAALLKVLQLALTVAGKANPADKLQVAQSAARTLDLGFE